MNFASMIQQAKQVQKRLQDAQKDLADANITAETGDGAVSVVCDGNAKFKSIKLNAEKLGIDAETSDTIEELVKLAMEKATADATKKMQDKMKGIVPAGLNIPGLF